LRHSCKRNLIVKTASWHLKFSITSNWKSIPFFSNNFCSLLFKKCWLLWKCSRGE